MKNSKYKDGVHTYRVAALENYAPYKSALQLKIHDNWVKNQFLDYKCA